MKYYFKRLIPLFLIIAIAMSACNGDNTITEEQIVINTMDSTATAVKDSTEKLQDQTKLVEESIDNLDASFNTKK